MYSDEQKKYFIKCEQDDAKGSIKIVINSSANGLAIKAPGFVFNSYIDEQVKENFLNQEACEVLHSELELDQLYHHGIKGQKWGLRRYQNEDGTLTEAGKARYNSDGTEKKAEKMSDEDLRRSSQRIQAEQNYINLRNREKPMKQVAKTAIASTIAAGATFAATYAGSRIYANVSNDKKLTKGKSLLLGLLASIGTAASVVGGRVGQVSVKQVKESKTDKDN